MRTRSRLGVLVAVCLAGLLPLAARANPAPVGSVHYIKHGLSVQPPRQKSEAGKVKQKLYAAYRLSTKRSEEASLNFQDGTLLYVNQRTDITLRSSSATSLTSGEVDVVDQNGSHHRITVGAVVASAIGTEYDVRVVSGQGGKRTITLTVVEGIVIVTAGGKSQQVGAGQRVTVSPNGSISPPVAIDAAAAIAWTRGLKPAHQPSPSPTPTPTSTPAPTNTPTPIPTPTATPSPTISAVLTATDLESGGLAPPNPLNCYDSNASKFSVSASGLIPSRTYNLVITGSAGGVTVNTPIGSITADQSGNVSGQTFTLPQIPSHDSWTLVATPASGGPAVTTPLDAGWGWCLQWSGEDQNNQVSITVNWAAGGWKPGTVLMFTVTTNGETTDSATVGPDGSVPLRTFSATCAVGLAPKFTVQGMTIDGPITDSSSSPQPPCA